jgi:MFS family permease
MRYAVKTLHLRGDVDYRFFDPAGQPLSGASDSCRKDGRGRLQALGSMMVFVWQVLIILAIVLASAIFGRRGLVASVAVAGVWTFVMIFTSWLMILQFLTIALAGIIGAAVCDKNKATTNEFHAKNRTALFETAQLFLGLAVFGGGFLLHELKPEYFRNFDSGAFGMAMGYGLALLGAAILGGGIIWLINGLGWRKWSVDTFRIGGGIAAVALGFAVLYGDRIFQERATKGWGQEESSTNAPAQAMPPTQTPAQRLQESLSVYVRETARKVPFTLRGEQQFIITSASQSGLSVIHQVRLGKSRASDINEADFLKKAGQALARQNCKRADMRAVFSQGAVFRYEIRSADGVAVGAVDVSKSSCGA